MATSTNAISSLGRQAEQTARAALRHPWIRPLARLGYAARGVVYSVVGLLAIQTAFGARGRQATDTRTALQWVAAQSTALLWLVALGLFGYALWRVVQGVLDTENKGRDPKGLVQRGAMLISGFVYGGLAFAAVTMALGSRSTGGGGLQGAGWTAELMSRPFGRWLVAAVGVAVIVAGLVQLRDGWTEKFCRHLKLNEMDAREEAIARRAGKLGLLARGVVFLLSGWFLLQAAWRFDAGEARGLAGALDTLAAQPAGPWLLGVVAVGLLAFGAYSLLLARYRRIAA